jgi:hypothetical protein
MSNWHKEWRELNSLVASLHRITMGLANSVGSRSGGDYHGVGDAMITPALLKARDTLRTFSSRHQGHLPANGDNLLQQLLQELPQFHGGLNGLPGTIALSTCLATICTQLEPHMQDSDEERIHIAERAFLHLQRIIVADDNAREAWQAAFARGEVACEKLGGVHLLHHGIYAVKSNAAGERTDLILGERLAITPRLRRAADAIALTEWKLVRDPAQLNTEVDQARRQAARYAAGSLAGFEISSVRFLVTISEDVLVERDDDQDDNVTYRHINVAVSPSVPSHS